MEGVVLLSVMSVMIAAQELFKVRVLNFFRATRQPHTIPHHTDPLARANIYGNTGDTIKDVVSGKPRMMFMF